RPALDQALATGIVAATNHGFVMTTQSACAALARRLVRDDGTPSGRVRSYAAQAAVGAGVAAAGAVTERLLAPQPGELMRPAGRRGGGRVGGWCGGGGLGRRGRGWRRPTRRWVAAGRG